MIKLYQKTLFFSWLAENRHLFKHEPYLVEEYEHGFMVRFDGIIDNIFCFFQKSGEIEIRIVHNNELFDILTDFDLYEKVFPDGRFGCSLCDHNPDNPVPMNPASYATREELWIKHSFEPLARWTRETLTEDAVLCLFQYDGGSVAEIGKRQAVDELRKEGGIFKEIPVMGLKPFTLTGNRYDANAR